MQETFVVFQQTYPSPRVCFKASFQADSHNYILNGRKIFMTLIYDMHRLVAINAHKQTYMNEQNAFLEKLMS